MGWGWDGGGRAGFFGWGRAGRRGGGRGGTLISPGYGPIRCGRFGVKNARVVKKVGEKKTPLGEKETPLGEKATKLAKKRILLRKIFYSCTWFDTWRPAADPLAAPKAANISTAIVAFDTFVSESGTGTNKTRRREIRGQIAVSTRNTLCPDTVGIFCVKLLIVSSSSSSNFDFVRV